MRVLVTGGMGYIGSHTCIALYNAGITPIIYDNLSNASIRVLDQLEKVTGSRFEFILGDIQDQQQFKLALMQSKVSAVFHFAALKAVGESTQQPLYYYQNNVSATIAMLQSMQQCNINHIVFSSSATVYGEPEYLPIDEAHPIRANNPYGWSKVMLEQVLHDLCIANPQFMAIALRYFNPVGAHESGWLGESPNGIPNNLMPFIAQTAVGKRNVVSIYGDDYATKDGTGVRDYIHVQDLAKGHVAAFMHHKHDTGYHRYNLGTGRGYSVLEMINAFSASANITIPYKIAPRRTGDIACNYADATKAQQKLGWYAVKTLSDMTNDTWRWQTNYPNGLES
ncbi:UDP-glucose 4-epimerase GalE [Pseudoalteromonas sp. MMG010]|uniref:UDP-glucose 4-epimerase GalE n=1 Tax=Pseudoalteromonas sp. MMG010 TaxID=2822685 RepID=UPI001B3A1F55|nr:UDP-glucose 4-epimerase GalE [Pseudoalteromonas sp. MMG010]MBQ4834175.1 UDP-glucose 4-epimerase GalE [Pseudoalteromonas sp. MMG010]